MKKKKALQSIGVIATFSIIWILGVLIYGEIVLADTLCFGSLFGQKYENLFALTPVAILMAGLIFTIIAKRKQSKEMFITTEVMLFLPFAAYLSGALLMATNTPLGIIGYICFIPGAPAFTCVGCLDSFFKNPFIALIVIPILYVAISLSYIFIYKYTNKEKV